MEVSSDNMLRMPFGTTSELLFSDIPIVDLVLPASALGAVTEGPAKANTANGEKSNDDQEQVHDEPVVSPVRTGDHSVPSGRTELHGGVKIIVHRERFTFRKSGFVAPGVFIDERTSGALCPLESILKSISLTMVDWTFLGGSRSFRWRELCKCLQAYVVDAILVGVFCLVEFGQGLVGLGLYWHVVLVVSGQKEDIPSCSIFIDEVVTLGGKSDHLRSKLIFRSLAFVEGVDLLECSVNSTI